MRTPETASEVLTMLRALPVSTTLMLAVPLLASFVAATLNTLLTMEPPTTVTRVGENIKPVAVGVRVILPPAQSKSGIIQPGIICSHIVNKVANR